jgi:hypothetical protein
MRSLLTLILFLGITTNLIALPVDQKEFDSRFKLLPRPQKVELLKGKALSGDDLRSLFLKGINERPKIEGDLYNLPLAEAPGKGVVSLIIAQDGDLPSSLEGYKLVLKDQQATITSRGEAGLFYGYQTLAQLLEDAKDQQVDIPSLQITDYPGTPYRAIHLDVRFHLDAVRYYYELIDRLAKIKVNAIIVELEDKLRYKRAPLVGAVHSISIEEFAAISRYAHDRNIDMSPLVQGLGHAGHILKHDEYKSLRDDPASDWAFDPLNPDTYKLQFALYQDAMEATPYGKYLHVGGDEVYNLGRSELCKKSGMKPVELQLYWLNKVTSFINQQGRKPICWDDMFFNLTGVYGTMRNNWKGATDPQIEAIWKENLPKLDNQAGKFPKDCVYMRWTYWNTKVLGNRKAIDWLLSKDLKVMGATAAQDMSPMLPRNNSLFDPIKDFSDIATEKKLDGILCTMWDDSSYSFDTFWRGIYTFASSTWNNRDLEKTSFNAAFRHRFYAPELSAASFEFQNLLEQALWFWDGALINNSTYKKHLSVEGVYNPMGDRGDRVVYPKSIDLIALPDASVRGTWSDKYKEKIEQARTEAARYDTIKQRIAVAAKLARRNYHSLDLMNCINDFQIYGSRLILSFWKYDKAASAAERRSARAEIRSLVNSFSTIRANLENVISQNRFLKNPEGYVRAKTADLANGGIDNEWMFLHETPMNEKIKVWLGGE